MFQTRYAKSLEAAITTPSWKEIQEHMSIILRDKYMSIILIEHMSIILVEHMSIILIEHMLIILVEYMSIILFYQRSSFNYTVDQIKSGL